jgi:hypothetical protein
VQSRVKRAEILDRVGDSCWDRGGIHTVSLNSNSATADILNRRNEFARTPQSGFPASTMQTFDIRAWSRDSNTHRCILTDTGPGRGAR